MKFYIASGYENKAEVQTMAAALKLAGHTHTYDWTIHKEPNKCEDFAGWEKVCAAEVAGVLEANVLIVLLPGGRGTHTELGIAISKDMLILLCARDEEALKQAGEPCPFYYAKSGQWIFGSMARWIKMVGEFMAGWLNEFRCINNYQDNTCLNRMKQCKGKRCAQAYGKCEYCRNYSCGERGEDCDECSHMPQQMWED